MRKLAALATLLVALLTCGVSVASGATNFYLYAGMGANSTLPVGNTASASIDVKSANVYVADGHAAAWVGVDDGGGGYNANCQNNANDLNIAWIQAGITYFDGSNPVFYIETKIHGQYCASIATWSGPALNTNYGVSIHHVSNGNWNATVNGHSLGTVNTGGSMSAPVYTTEGLNDTIGQTSEIDSVFSNLSPWSTSSMFNITSNDETTVTNKTSSSFEGIQYSYNGSCYPTSCFGPAFAPAP
jgi:hypothetical protein